LKQGISDRERAALGAVVQDSETGSVTGVEATQEKYVKRGGRVEPRRAAHLEQAIRVAADQLVINTCAGLLVVSIDEEGKRSTKHSSDHPSSHQDVSVDDTAAENAGMNVHDGGAGCGERAVHKGLARRLRVIRAGSEQPRASDIYEAGIREGSMVDDRPSVRDFSGVADRAGGIKSQTIARVNGQRVFRRDGQVVELVCAFADIANRPRNRTRNAESVVRTDANSLGK
jgi:hypothetical protein